MYFFRIDGQLLLTFCIQNCDKNYKNMKTTKNCVSHRTFFKMLLKHTDASRYNLHLIKVDFDVGKKYKILMGKN